MVRRIWIAGIAAVGLALAACGGGGGSDGAVAPGSDPAAVDVGQYARGPGPQGGVALYSDFRSGKKLVLHQRDSLAVTPTTLRDRILSMEVALTAFDGVFLKMPNTTDQLTRGSAVAASTIAADLEPLYALRPTRLKYNFAVVKMQHDLDPFDDWSAVYANFTKLAQVARDAGLVGIVVDDESVAGLRVSFPSGLKYSGKTLEAYRAQMQLVGRQIMQAIGAGFPDAVVVVLRGAAGSEPKSPPNLVNLEVDSAPLLGSFFAGFVEGRTARALLVDGGTDYGLRTAEQFDGSVAWRKAGIASADTDSAFIAASLRNAWPGAVDAAFGVRELDGAHGNQLPNDPALWTSTLVQALRSADTLVWASFDATDLTKAAAGSAWVAGAATAKAVAATPTMHLASTVSATGTGLLAQYFSQLDESELAQTVVDPSIDNVWTGIGPNNALAGQTDNFSVVWSGYLEAPVTGTYTIFGTTDDGMQIFVGGTAVVDAFYYQGPTEYAGTIDLVAGMRYPIKIRYFQGGGDSEAHIAWQPPGGAKTPVPMERLYPYY